jgi:hypothetical protein
MQKTQHSPQFIEQALGKTLWLRASGMVVALYEDYRHLCTHMRAKQSGQRVTVTDHLPPNVRVFFEYDCHGQL